GAETIEVELLSAGQNEARALINGKQYKGWFARDAAVMHVQACGRAAAVSDRLFAPRAGGDPISDGAVRSPSDGLVVSVDASAGQIVKKGDKLCAVEAMKLIQPVCARASGKVLAVLVSAGQQVKAKQQLMQIETANDESERARPASDGERRGL